ncbi:MAG: hypothetical protein ACXWBT_15010 [Usitatibacter sp.]
MPVHSRNKGQRGERELFAKLSELLGFEVKRNVNAREGDCDSFELTGWAPEVKRVEDWREDYWTQAVTQARKLGREPVLFHRVSHKAWSAFIDLGVIQPSLRGIRAAVSLEAFAIIFTQRDLAA